MRESIEGIYRCPRRVVSRLLTLFTYVIIFKSMFNDFSWAPFTRIYMVLLVRDII
jgi:hypothetical protein